VSDGHEPEMLAEEKALFARRAYAHIATVSADGTPQVTPVWIELHDDTPRFSTVKGRVKHRNLERDPRIALSMIDPESGSRFIQVRGTVTFEDDINEELIRRLAQKYMGDRARDWKPGPGERVVVNVHPRAISSRWRNDPAAGPFDPNLVPPALEQPAGLEYARQVATDAAWRAAELVRGRMRGTFSTEVKGPWGEVVTELDHLAEGLVLERLRQAFPGPRIISEEIEPLPGEDRWTWLIDPLDGSNNIAIGLPMFAICITLLDKDRPVMAVIHDGQTDTTWSTIRGQGANGPGTPLEVRPPNDERHMTVGWAQGYQVPRGEETVLALRAGLQATARRVLDLWAPSLSWAMLAQGRLDALMIHEAGGTDLHGGLLMALEAGAEVVGFDGQPLDGRFDGTEATQSLLAGHPRAVELLLPLVANGGPPVTGPPDGTFPFTVRGRGGRA
jgi:myo-inositol-1(or 4)-monophosphatase